MKPEHKISSFTILLACTYIIGQAYELFEGMNITQNWILFKYRPMLIAWNVKFLSEEICRVIEALALYVLAMKYKVDQDFMIPIKIYLVYRMLDIPMYFLNYKTQYYWTVYVVLGLIELYLRYKRKKEYKN